MNLVYKILTSSHFAFSNSCHKPSFFGIPTWYQYLSATNTNGVCNPQFGSISDVWLIVAAIIEILLRVAALIAVGIIIWAGIQYATSQGNPDTTSKALSTIINAAIGLAFVILSAVLVTFIAGRF